MKHTYKICIALAALLLPCAIHTADACTGIALKTKDDAYVLARTVEWLKTPMNCGYAIVPRGYKQTSMGPAGKQAMTFKARYGYAGVYTEYEPFIVDGLNEKGLSAGLFFFPGFGTYPEFDESKLSSSICDMQLVSWVLSNFATIDEMKEGLAKVQVCSLDPAVGTVHWRFSEPGGRIVVLEFIDGKPVFYENPLGTLTNSPDFAWHQTNMRNYINLVPGAADNQTLAEGFELEPLGGGTGLLGIPGDFTPPSRFVRAAIFSANAPVLDNTFDTVTMAFHILNNFDIPIGVQHKKGQCPEGLPSATQITTSADLSGLKYYFKTAWNQNIRCIDLSTIDFKRVKYQSALCDPDKTQPVDMIKVK